MRPIDDMQRQADDLFRTGDISLKNALHYGTIQLDKLEFVGVNDENFIYDWWHYGSWKNNCVPTALTGFTE